MSLTSIGSRASFFALLLLTGGFLAVARAAGDGGNLKFIDNPGGGQIVYGPLETETSFQGAMASMLHNVHGHFGDRPKVGNFFQAGGPESIATFFTLNAQTSGGGRPIAGMVIVTIPAGAKPAAAVIYDDAGRFGRTLSGLMKKLNEAWKQETVRPAGTQAAASPAPSREVALHQVTMGDRSASISLPGDWRLTAVAGGQLTAEGPNGEMVNLGILYQQIHDPNGPQNGWMPMGGNGRPLVAPLGGDVFNSFVSLTNQVRAAKGLSAGTFQLVSSRPLPSNQQEQVVIEAIFEADLHDGRGPRKGSARVGEMHVRGLPTWAMTVSASNAPTSVADDEAALMMAVVHSYSQDAAVIGRETQQVIDRIHRVAEAGKNQADAIHNASMVRTQAIEKTWDDNAKYNKSFENYQLDRTIVADNEQNLHVTTGYTLGDALVKSDPNRFHVLPTQDLLKGVDY